MGVCNPYAPPPTLLSKEFLVFVSPWCAFPFTPPLLPWGGNCVQFEEHRLKVAVSHFNLLLENQVLRTMEVGALTLGTRAQPGAPGLAWEYAPLFFSLSFALFLSVP